MVGGAPTPDFCGKLLLVVYGFLLLCVHQQILMDVNYMGIVAIPPQVAETHCTTIFAEGAHFSTTMLRSVLKM